jgi:hypothetical protein
MTSERLSFFTTVLETYHLIADADADVDVDVIPFFLTLPTHPPSI